MNGEEINAAGPEDAPYRLGKKPARHSGILFRLTDYFNLTALPTPPDHFRHDTPPTWLELANKKYGNCVFVGAANESRLWEHEGGMPVPEFTVENVLSDYSAVTGFDRNRPDTDKGTDMGQACSYRRRVGVIDARGNRHKIDAYAWLRLGNLTALKVALWMFPGLGLGFKFPDYGMKQYDANKPWDIQSGSTIGGHYVPAVGWTPEGNIICVSWGREQLMAPPFYLKYADEVTICIDLDRMSKQTNLTPENFNEQRLREDLEHVAAGRVYALNAAPTSWA